MLLPIELSSHPIYAGLISQAHLLLETHGWRKSCDGCIPEFMTAFLKIMKQPIENEQQKEDKKNNPSKGIDPEQKQPEMEADLNDQDPGERQKENQNQQKDDPLAA